MFLFAKGGTNMKSISIVDLFPEEITNYCIKAIVEKSAWVDDDSPGIVNGGTRKALEGLIQKYQKEIEDNAGQKMLPGYLYHSLVYFMNTLQGAKLTKADYLNNN